MTKEIRFNKKGIDFILKNPKLDEYDQLEFSCKISECNEENFFRTKKYDEEEGNIYFYVDKVIKNTKAKGIKLEGEIKEQVDTIFKTLKEKRENLFNVTVNEIVEGIRPIEFGIVGCDYPHYQAWLHDIGELNGQEQKIIEEAIDRLIKSKTGKNEYISNPCDYIKNKLKQNIDTKENIHEKAFNLEYNKEKQDYHGYKNTIVTNFSRGLC